jgi:hypothetical protein
MGEVLAWKLTAMIHPALVLATLAVLVANGCGGRESGSNASTGASNGSGFGVGAGVGTPDEGGRQDSPNPAEGGAGSKGPASCTGPAGFFDPSGVVVHASGTTWPCVEGCGLLCSCKDGQITVPSESEVRQQCPCYTCPSTSGASESSSGSGAVTDASTVGDTVAGREAMEAESGCHATSDCPIDYTCAWPGVSLGCPGAHTCEILSVDRSVVDPKSIPGCQSDIDCADAGAGFICTARGQCSCYVNPYCVAGCTGSSQCDEGQVCTAYRCVAAPCETVTDCPNNFICSGSCSRKTCAKDADCNGYCLGGECYDNIGQCVPPVL